MAFQRFSIQNVGPLHFENTRVGSVTSGPNSINLEGALSDSILKSLIRNRPSFQSSQAQLDLVCLQTYCIKP